jgi:hypothetical protein
MAEEEKPVKENPIIEKEDPCNQAPIDATAACNSLAKAEGDGSYNQRRPGSSVYGRYQFDRATGVAEAVKARPELGAVKAKELWENCQGRITSECKKLQDDMCRNYSGTIISQLKAKGISPTPDNLYLAWNQGAAGAKQILDAGNGEVVNSTRRNKMAQQAWNKVDTTYNGAEFISRMRAYLAKRGYPQT